MLTLTQRCALVGTSRGCPFPCSFCYENMIGGTGFRRNTTSGMIADIREKKKFFGTNRFWISDSNFGTNPTHTEQTLQSIINADLNCVFSSLCRVEIGSRPHILDLMKKAGMSTVSVGMETLRDEQLTSIEKRQSVDDIRRTIDQIQSHGIAVFGLFMVGFDDDTEDTPWEIIEFCRKEGVAGLSLYCLSEYPALPGRSLPRHRICEDNLDYYSGHFVTTFPRRVRPSVLEQNVYDALLDYYSVSKIIHGLATLDRRSLQFGVPLYWQMRKMAAISKSHCDALRSREERYYSHGGVLHLDLLQASPWLNSALPEDTMECWADAVEHRPASEGPRSESTQLFAAGSEEYGQVNFGNEAPHYATSNCQTSSAIHNSGTGSDTKIFDSEIIR
ncbi:MAG: radical SAM protein [Pirellulales bacterium]|nr:radical SAM protein [Pirellulales bacterium]